MSSPAGTVTPVGESIASSYCGSDGGLTPLATSPSGDNGGFDGGFLASRATPAVIHDHIRCPGFDHQKPLHGHHHNICISPELEKLVFFSNEHKIIIFSFCKGEYLFLFHIPNLFQLWSVATMYNNSHPCLVVALTKHIINQILTKICFFGARHGNHNLHLHLNVTNCCM